MKQIVFATAAGLLSVGTALASPSSGVVMDHFDDSVRPQDDLYRHVNGKWLSTAEIPDDKSSHGAFYELRDAAELQLRAIIEEAASSDAPPGSDMQKIGDMYASFIDEARVNAAGLEPLQADLNRLELLSNLGDLPDLLAHLNVLGVSTIFDAYVYQDAKNPDAYALYLEQGGLALPDRDYYLDNNPKFKQTLAAYKTYIGRILTLAGTPNAAAVADRIIALETGIAKLQWTKVDTRDAEKTYNKYAMDELDELMPQFDFGRMLKQSGVSSQAALIVGEPSFFSGLSELLASTDIDTLREYMRLRLISAYAPYLSADFVSARFDFYGRALRGTKVNKPRWKRAVDTVEGSLGEVLGRIYVQRHFPPQAKARMEELVANLLEAYRISINELEWMGADTKKQALTKLANFRTKIGYPSRWKDYSALSIRADDLLGNVRRSRIVEHNREVAKLTGPVDREEWFMTPQTVNAYYSPVGNEIVFPAAILQPPFFDVNAEDAVNYGAIGAVIGHEIGHGFDDQGSRYDGNGNLRNWWTDADRERFEERTHVLIEQYSAYEPIPGFNVNGALTIGENIGDLGGLSIAYEAYMLALDGKTPAVIDGFSGKQRFFIGWAQAWRGKYRDEVMIERIKSDPHSPPEYRCNGVVANLPAFYDTFGVKPSDELYREPEKRIQIW